MEEKVLSLAKELGDAGHDFLIVVAKDGKIVGRSHNYSNKKNAEVIVQEIGNEITKLLNFINTIAAIGAGLGLAAIIHRVENKAELALE